MGMHEIESAVEQSVKFLDQHLTDDEMARSYFWNLFNYQAYYDTGNTTFRVMDILVKRQLYFKVTKDNYPEYEKYKQALDEIEHSPYPEIYQNPNQEWDAKTNPEVALYNHEDGFIYFEIGTYPWQQLNALDQLPNATPPSEIPIEEIVATICTLAQDVNNAGIARTWFSILPIQLCWFGQGNILDLMENDSIKTIKTIAKEMHLIEMQGDEWEYGFLHIPNHAEIEGSGADENAQKFMRWWFYG